jgi:Ca2+-binding RTX toxin-like protein
MSRRAPMLLAAIAVMVALFAAAAYAAVIITGTGKSDVLYESQQDFRNDTIDGKGGDDILNAGNFRRDKDLLDGGTGVDTLNAEDGDKRDTLDGGTGDLDKCTGDPLDTYENCEIVKKNG